MKQADRDGPLEMPAGYRGILYRRHLQSALVRSVTSVLMWSFALAAYLSQIIKENHFIGISFSVLYLIFMNPPTLLLLKRVRDKRLYRYCSLGINFLEILGYTAIIYFLGGIEATFLTPVYAAIITYVGAFAPRGFPYAIAVLCSAAFSFLVASEYLGFLPVQRVVTSFDPPWLTRFAYLSVVIGLLFVVAYISSLTAGTLKRNRNRLREQNVELVEKAASLEKAEKDLRTAQQGLETRVEERTEKLRETNDRLKAEITERKRLEEELRRARDELEVKVCERTAELEHKNQELQEFAFIASHDLSEPLRKIQTFGDLLKAKSADHLSELERDYVSRMTGAATRMQELLDALLRYSRIETQGRDFVPMKLEDIARAVTTDLEVSINKIAAHVEIGPLPIIHGDPYQWRQLFQNLIANPLKYHRSEVKTHIKVYGEVNDGKLRIFVEDNGIGFEEKYLDKIFQPFQRLHGKNEYSGTGIGLAICRKIVGRHGGSISARSTPGKGSTFIVSLPVNVWKGDGHKYISIS